jgi:plasmid stabilization system protein ParE
MIEVILTQRAEQHKARIAFYRWENLPSGTDDEIEAAFRIVQAELAKVDRAVNQLRRLPESGPVKAGAIRKITIPDSRYTMAYRITKNFKRVTVLSIRGAQKPIKW